jgi:hypothetical protein
MTKNQRRIARAEKNRESEMLGLLARVDAGVQGTTRHTHVMWPWRNMAPKGGFVRGKLACKATVVFLAR